MKEWVKSFCMGQEYLECEARTSRSEEVKRSRRLKVKKISELAKLFDTNVRRLMLI